MITTYRLHVNELSQEWLDSIKAAYQNKTVEITVTDLEDETAFLLRTDANKNHLFSSMQELAEGRGVEMTVQDVLEKYSTGNEKSHA